MTFEKWWKDNRNEVSSNISCRNFTGINGDFEACWHDGYKQGRRLNRHSSGRAEACGVCKRHDIHAPWCSAGYGPIKPPAA